MIFFDVPKESIEKKIYDLKNGHSFRENGILILENLNKHNVFFIALSRAARLRDKAAIKKNVGKVNADQTFSFENSVKTVTSN